MVRIEPITHIINGEYIREWLILGSFLPDDLGKDFLVNVGGEASAQPKEGDTVSTSEGETLTWKHHKSEADVVDLLAAIGNYEYATAYAFCILQSENAGDIKIYLGSDDGVAVWINGEQVHSNDADRALTLDQDTFCADLKAGANHCLVKVCNITRSWEFAMRVLPTNRAVVFGTIRDEAGAPILNADVRLERDEKEIAQTTTDNSGSYRLDIYPASGTYDLSATSRNLGDRQLGINLDEGERQKLDLTLKEETNIEGTLLMLDDTTPHVAVPVQVIRDGEVAATVLSNEGGRYRFINLKPGSYQVRCQVLGGYIYYGEEKAGKPESRTMSDKPIDPLAHEPIGLRVEQGRTIVNIDFRFAPFKKGTWRQYRVMDGLTHDFVYDIYRDPDGVMWFGTDGCGLSRYDGRTFTNFTIRDGLAGNSVTDIHCDPDGIMWFATKASGVSIYDGRTFVNLTTEDGLASNRVSAIHQDPDGIMWFGTAEGVSRYDGETFVNLTTRDGLVHNRVLTIHQAPDGAMWFGTYGGVSRYDGETFVNLTTRDGLVHNRVLTVHQAPDGAMWFGTYGGVSRYDGETFVNLTMRDGLADNSVNVIHQDPGGVLWFGTDDGGVSRYDGKTFVNFTTRDGLTDNEIHAIHRDPDGVLWFATYGGGVSRYDERTFINLTTRDGLVHNYVRAMHRDRDGVLWFGTYSGGVSRYDGETFVNLTTEDGLAHNDVWAIHQDPDGVMWFTTRGGGVSRYDGKTFANLTTEDGLPSNNLRRIHQDPDGVMWFGTAGGGVSRYDGKTFVNLTTADGLASNNVHAIHRDPDGAMWIGTWDGGVSRYDGREFVNFPIGDGFIYGHGFTIYTDRDDVLWFGTIGGGLSRYDGQTSVHFTREDGFMQNSVWAIHQDPDGVMWFGTAGGGVAGYDGVAWTLLDERDGLPENGVWSIDQDEDGSLWFATRGGISCYRPSKTPPKAHIVSVTTDTTYRDLSALLSFTVGTRITIQYGALDFKTIPEKRQYRCRVYETGDMRLETSRRGDLDSTVSSLKSDVPYNPPTRNTTFDWTPEKPGTYVFEVQAIDRDLNYSEPASVKLEVITDPRNHQIAQLKGELAERERAELERVYQELKDARQIQQSLLPDSIPEIEGFEIAATSLPAREVSGDFYNYLLLGNSVGIVLADVTGKSVKAAMVAALTDGMLSEALNAQREYWNSPSKILRRLSIGIRPRLIRGMYTAMSLGIIQPEKKRLIFSNAGMPYPIVKRGNEVQELEVNGVPLGLMDEAKYEDLSLDLEKGDLVIFYSDGVIEAENGAEEMYQTERLLESIHQTDPGISAQEMVDLVVKDVTAFVSGEEASDDITIVVLRCKE